MPKVSILGTDYEVQFSSAWDDELLNSNSSSGYTDYTIKLIKVCSDYAKDYMNLADLDIHTRNTIRHEIIHAFFYESGLSEICQNEEIVEWIALQMPKILLTCKVAEELYDAQKENTRYGVQMQPEAEQTSKGKARKAVPSNECY